MGDGDAVGRVEHDDKIDEGGDGVAINEDEAAMAVDMNGVGNGKGDQTPTQASLMHDIESLLDELMSAGSSNKPTTKEKWLSVGPHVVLSSTSARPTVPFPSPSLSTSAISSTTTAPSPPPPSPNPNATLPSIPNFVRPSQAHRRAA